MNQLLIDAIRNLKAVSFSYHGEHRTVETHCYGRDTKGHDALRGFQINKGWRLFHLAEMYDLHLSGQTFSVTRQGYSRDDRGMEYIYAQI